MAREQAARIRLLGLACAAVNAKDQADNFKSTRLVYPRETVRSSHGPFVQKVADQMRIPLAELEGMERMEVLAALEWWSARSDWSAFPKWMWKQAVALIENEEEWP